MIDALNTSTLIAVASVIILMLVGLFIYLKLWHNRPDVMQQNKLDKIEHKKQQEILKMIIRAQEQERNRIAANLHDSVGAELSMLKLNLSKYAYYLKNTNFDSGPLIKDLENLDQTIENIRSICRDLYPVTLQNYGFIKTFEELVSKINDTQMIVCKYKINLKEEDLFNEIEHKLNLLRLFQEVINNLIKYANCTALDIGFMKYEAAIKIILKHNGIAFDNQDVDNMLLQGKGVGLTSINNRINLMNGKIDYAAVNNGAEIIIELPNKDARKN